MIGTVLKDHPFRISLGLCILVAVHAAATTFTPLHNIWSGLLAQDGENIAAVYLGLAGIVAIISGFAGVVVVFGLSAPYSVFRRFRFKSGRSLVANWITPTGEGLTSAALSLVSVLVLYAAAAQASAWIFELALVLALHSGARLLWLLIQLIRLVQADDAKTTAAESITSLDELFSNS